MGTRSIPQLPQAIALTGAELLEAVQVGTSVRVTAALLASLAGQAAGIGTYLSVAPAAGVYQDFNPTGFGTGVGRLDIDTSAGDVTLGGLQAGKDGQLLVAANIGPNNLILNPLDGDSDTANQLRLSGQIYVSPQYQASLLCYYGGSVNKWCMA